MLSSLKWIALAVIVLGGAFLVLTPSLCRSRETANRVKCGSNLSQISRAIVLYADQNHGQMPDSFTTLLRTQDLVPEVFTCPSGPAERAESVEAFRDSEKDCSYIYCGDGVPLMMSDEERARLAEHDQSARDHRRNPLFLPAFRHSTNVTI